MSIEPGETAFTRIPSPPNSLAREDTKWIWAAFAAPYWACGPASTRRPRPPRRSSRHRQPANEGCSPDQPGHMANVHLPGRRPVLGRGLGDSPASRTSRTRDDAVQAVSTDSASSTNCSSNSGTETSRGRVNSASVESSERRSASSGSAFRAHVATRAPSDRSKRTTCPPSPLEPPVTTMRRSVNRCVTACCPGSCHAPVIRTTLHQPRQPACPQTSSVHSPWRSTLAVVLRTYPVRGQRCSRRSAGTGSAVPETARTRDVQVPLHKRRTRVRRSRP